MKTGRPKTTYRINIDYLKGRINPEADIIIELYNNYLITHKEALQLIDKSMTPLDKRDGGWRDIF
jgi:hypothetical protein